VFQKKRLARSPGAAHLKRSAEEKMIAHSNRYRNSWILCGCAWFFLLATPAFLFYSAIGAAGAPGPYHGSISDTLYQVCPLLAFITGITALAVGKAWPVRILSFLAIIPSGLFLGYLLWWRLNH
jgi:hypothetical protein